MAPTGRWTTIPPWLYQNTLPDAELQAVYVAEARKKVADLRQRRLDAEDALAELEGALADAEDFLAHAEAALRGYQAQAQSAGPPSARRAHVRAARLLPVPKEETTGGA